MPYRSVRASLRVTGCRLLPVLVLGLLVAACTPAMLQRADSPTEHTYFLDWQGEGNAPQGPASGPNLLVSPMLAAPGFDGSEMAYVRTQHEIEYFAHHRWVDAPARMLEPLLLRAAERTGLFHSVVSPGSRADVELRLDSRLVHLRQLYRSGSGEIQLAVRLVLVEMASGRVLSERVIEVNEPLQQFTPYDGVEAANRAVARLMSGVQDFLAQQVKSRQGV
jgi:cholesterol transport system auxiliary component